MILRTRSTLVALSLTLVPLATVRLDASPTSAPARPAATSALQEHTRDLEPEQLEGLIESLAALIEERYIFEDVAKQIGEQLRQQLWDGRYEGITLDLLAARLTEDLQSVNGDLHLNARRLPPEQHQLDETDPEEAQRMRIERARRANFGFSKVEILDGNVGYLDLRGFNHTRCPVTA